MGLYLQDRHDIAYELEVAAYAERRGFAEIWQADTRLARDCVVLMSALLAETRTLRIGSGVLPIWTRNPAVIAATWSTMWELAGLTPDGESRVMLGLGAWWEPIASRVGADRRKPLTAMREHVEALEEAEGRTAVGRNPIGAGPFSLRRWERGVQVEFERFDEYWDPRARPDQMVFLENISADVASARFRNGGIDIVYRPSKVNRLFLRESRAWARCSMPWPKAGC